MQIQSNGFKMNSEEFQRKALESLTRLEEGQTELTERYVKLERGYANLNDKIDFVLHDLRQFVTDTCFYNKALLSVGLRMKHCRWLSKLPGNL